MKSKPAFLFLLMVLLIFISGCAQKQYSTSLTFNNLTITWFGHSSFQIKYNGTAVYLDPFVLPESPGPANFILLTSDSPDHCNPEKVRKIQLNTGEYTKRTSIIGTKGCIKKLTGRINEIKPPEYFEFSLSGVKITATKTYNKGRQEDASIGFLLTIGNRTKIYFAGDTSFIPEASGLKSETIDIAFLPIGGNHTMDVEEASKTALEIRPKVVIPMHYNSERYGIDGANADPEELKELLRSSGIEVEILKPLE